MKKIKYLISLFGIVSIFLVGCSNVIENEERYIQVQHRIGDENKYADDAEMAHILHRLQSAAANPDIRNRMTAEDVYFKPLEDRDTVIMQQNKIIEEQDAVLKTLEEQNAVLEEQKASLRAAVLALSKSGMAAEMIAKTLHIEEEKIKEILS